MITGVTFSPLFPAEYIVLLGAIVAVFSVINYYRARREAGRVGRTMLAILRLAVVAGLVTVLLRPMRPTAEQTAAGRRVFTVLVDGSRSMATADVAGKARYDVVRAQLEQAERNFLRELGAAYDVEFGIFSDSLGRAPLKRILTGEPDQSQSTDIATALVNAVSGAAAPRHAGVLLISDGRDNSGNDPLASAAYLRSAGVPIWTTTVGTTDEARDLLVTARLDQNFLFRDQPSTLHVDLHQRGYDGWYARVELLRDGVVVATQQCMLKAGVEPVRFPVREPARGTFRYTVRVEPLAGESDSMNNERSLFVQVVDERARILFVEASPYWDSKFLLRTLQADPNLEVDAIFNMSENRNKMVYVTQAFPEDETGEGAAGTLRVPRTREEFFRYDCIILGRRTERIFNREQAALLKEYVETRGGNIIFARGPAYGNSDSPLAEIEPLVWDDSMLERARFELTSAGAVNPMFNFGGNQPPGVVLRELPDMISITRVKQEKSLAVVLARGVDPNDAEIATIAYQRYGKGKVMTIGAAGLWQWAFMKDELSRYDGVYAQFWGQMIRWLVYDSEFLPGQDITFRSDQFSYSTGDPVMLIVQSREARSDFAPQVTITAPGGAPTALALTQDSQNSGRFSATYYPAEEGTYTAVLADNGHGLGEQTIEFAVYVGDIETRFVGANPELMAQIAAAGGGEPVALDDWASVPEKLKQHERAMREETRPEDAWDTLPNFLLLAGLLGVEWFIRRHLGMV